MRLFAQEGVTGYLSAWAGRPPKISSTWCSPTTDGMSLAEPPDALVVSPQRHRAGTACPLGEAGFTLDFSESQPAGQWDGRSWVEAERAAEKMIYRAVAASLAAVLLIAVAATVAYRRLTDSAPDVKR